MDEVVEIQSDRKKLDKELVLRIVKGDNKAFTELVGAYYVIFYSLALGILHDTGRAEDMVQEGLITMYKELESLHNPERFGSWGYTIIRRKCLRAIHNLKSESNILEEYSEHESIKELQNRPQNEPMDKVQNKSRMQIILNAISELSPHNYREILMLYYIENIDLAEIAKRLDLSLQTANIRLFRARKKLRKVLKGLIEC